MIPQSFSNLIKISNNIIIKIKKKFDHKPLPLGRWNIIYDERVSHRVERANEDHCGTCVNPPKETTLGLEKRS